MFDAESEHIELCFSDDTESGEEGDKKEKDAKCWAHLYLPKFETSISPRIILHTEDFMFLHHPETATPPPEFFPSLKAA